MTDDLLEWLDCPCSSEVCLPRTAKAHIEAQAAEIDYWKTEARNVRRELKSEQKQTDSAMDNYDAMQRRCEAQAAEIEKLREAVEYYADRDNQCPNEGPWGVNSTDFGLVALKALKALGETK